MPAMPQRIKHPCGEVEDTPFNLRGPPPKSLIERGLVRFFIVFFYMFFKFEMVICIVNVATPGVPLG